MELSNKDKERFWNKVNKTDGCWEWNAYCANTGYGWFRHNGKNIYSHRLSFMMHHNREIIPGLFILHSCDNRKCVRPDHLREGTNLENMREMVARNRAAKGSNHSQAKLTEEQVINIRTEYATGDITQQQLADKYNVCQSSILLILNRKRWKHI